MKASRAALRCRLTAGPNAPCPCPPVAGWPDRAGAFLAHPMSAQRGGRRPCQTAFARTPAARVAAGDGQCAYHLQSIIIQLYTFQPDRPDIQRGLPAVLAAAGYGNRQFGVLNGMTGRPQRSIAPSGRPGWTKHTRRRRNAVQVVNVRLLIVNTAFTKTARCDSVNLKPRGGMGLWGGKCV